MFDDLRKEATGAAPEGDSAQAKSAEKAPAPKARRKSKKIFGLTAQQRFIVAVMLMLMVCAIGSMLLLVTGKIGF
jgi:hypothetical protein